MARRRRLLAGGVTHHVIQRGNDRKPIFFNDDDRILYLNWLSGAITRHGALLRAYVLMTNHVHLLMIVARALTLPRILQSLGRRYVAHVNRTYRRTGALWEGRHRSTVLDSDGYVLSCHRYIEANPLLARMVAQAADYPWSSYRHNALGEPDPPLVEHPVYNALGRDTEERRMAYRNRFEEGLGEDILRVLRDATQQGWVPASEKFQAEIEAATGGRTVRPPRRGRPPKPSSRDEGAEKSPKLL
jgi:putative transposase